MKLIQSLSYDFSLQRKIGFYVNICVLFVIAIEIGNIGYKII